jgi:hypothetical protein
MRNFCAGLLAAALLMSTAAHADDNTGVCVALEAQLAQLDRGPPPGQDPHQYDEPIARQQDQLDRATDQAHDAGCMGGFLFFRPRPQASCGALMAAIGKMQANLRRLEQAQARLGGDDYAGGQQRNDLLRQLAYNRCAAAPQVGGEPVVEDSGGGFLRDLFGGSIFQPQQPNVGGTGYGTYRTLCVRTCDGYYFPISFSTVPSQFGTDAATCQAMCPGAEAQLYTYRNPGGDVSQMVSLSGQPYSALPTAFRYRSIYDKACTCHGAAPATIAAGGRPAFTQFPADGSALSSPDVPPLGSPEPAAKAPPPATASAEDGSKKVRIVGPNYYYGQQN